MAVVVNIVSDTKIEIVGSHDGKEIIILDCDGDVWNVGYSRSISGFIGQAEVYLAVYNEAFAKMNELRSSQRQ